MLERLNTCLLHPKFIGKYISDKAGRIFLYFLLLIVLVSVPTFFSLYYPIGIPTSVRNSLISQIEAKSFTANDTFNNDTLNNETKFSITTGNYVFNFGDSEAKSTFSNIFFDFRTSEVDIYVGGQKIMHILYEGKGLQSFSFSQIKLTNVVQADAFIHLLEYSYQQFAYLEVPFEIFTTVLGIAFLVVAIALMMYLFSGFINPGVPGKFRMKICFYSTTIFLICDLFGVLFGFAVLDFVGMILSYIYLNLALRAIVRVEVKKQG